VKSKLDRHDENLLAVVARQRRMAENQITAYGTIIHELSHIVLNTKDHPTSMAGAEAQGQVCYGPLVCQMLAAHDSLGAVTNADNYRLLAECFGPRAG
jgi:hypothetical protein